MAEVVRFWPKIRRLDPSDYQIEKWHRSSTVYGGQHDPIPNMRHSSCLYTWHSWLTKFGVLCLNQLVSYSAWGPFESKISMSKISWSSLTRVTKSYLLALGTTQISSYFTKHWCPFFFCAFFFFHIILHIFPSNTLGCVNAKRSWYFALYTFFNFWEYFLFFLVLLFSRITGENLGKYPSITAV